MYRSQIIQNAYYVPDIDEAITQMHSLWGIGPFFVRRHIPLENVRYKGASSELDISAAYVQCGELMVELVTQHNNAPSIFRDMYAPNERGFHHVALAFGDHDREVAHFNALGFESVTSFRTAEGRGATYIDTRALLGHATEVYIVNDSLKALYEQVRRAAEHWDRTEVMIEL